MEPAGAVIAPVVVDDGFSIPVIGFVGFCQVRSAQE